MKLQQKCYILLTQYNNKLHNVFGLMIMKKCTMKDTNTYMTIDFQETDRSVTNSEAQTGQRK
jgi:hypothetical protein